MGTQCKQKYAFKTQLIDFIYMYTIVKQTNLGGMMFSDTSYVELIQMWCW